MRMYRVGLVGCGFIGKVHAYGYRNLSLFYDQDAFGARITHVATSRPDTAARAAAVVGADHAVTDFRAITENPDIDIVDIASPNARHKEAILSAIRHGKHIYCDKPLTATLAEAEEVEAALEGYTGIGQMTLQNRFFPSTLRAKQLIDAGALGKLLEFRAHYHHSGSADPNAPLKWKLSGAAGGGVVADLGSHILDLVEHLLGDIAEVFAVTHTAYPDRPDADDPARRVAVDAEDNMQVLARLAGGAVGTVSASKIATGAEDEVGFSLHGAAGALRLDPMNWDKLFYYNVDAAAAPLGGVRGWTAIDCGQRYPKPAGFPTPKASIGWMRGHLHCLYTFLESVHTGRASGPTLAQGVRVQRLMEAVRRSARERAWVAPYEPVDKRPNAAMAD